MKTVVVSSILATLLSRVPGCVMLKKKTLKKKNCWTRSVISVSS
jgi:uncharacterized membrane protein